MLPFHNRYRPLLSYELTALTSILLITYSFQHVPNSALYREFRTGTQLASVFV